MRVYISGISGTGMGPLALMAHDAGYEVCGSDLAKGAVYDELVEAGIEVSIGKQDGKFLKKQLKKGVDWFVYTSALPETHAELAMAREAGIKCTKRDDFTEYLVEDLDLKMVAVAGTHGKTTTTSMIVWLCQKMGLPVSYVVGTTLGFAPSGAYQWDDEYFVYEADEYDRNFLKYHPWLAVVTTVSYDHPDVYKKPRDYKAAFMQFKAQSENVLEATDQNKGVDGSDYALAGKVRREDASYAMGAVLTICMDLMEQRKLPGMPNIQKMIEAMNEFPGVGRRFERICDGLYSDYAHHPEEIAATMDVAMEECRLREKKGVVVIYQPHQNVRQHEMREGYRDAFCGAEKIYWLPTYLTRENPDLAVISPEELISGLANAEVAEVAELGDELVGAVRDWLRKGFLVVLMTAGPADEWLRAHFK